MLVEMNAYMSNYDDQPKEATEKIYPCKFPSSIYLSISLVQQEEESIKEKINWKKEILVVFSKLIQASDLLRSGLYHEGLLFYMVIYYYGHCSAQFKFSLCKMNSVLK